MRFEKVNMPKGSSGKDGMYFVSLDGGDYQGVATVKDTIVTDFRPMAENFTLVTLEPSETKDFLLKIINDEYAVQEESSKVV